MAVVMDYVLLLLEGVLLDGAASIKKKRSIKIEKNIMSFTERGL